MSPKKRLHQDEFPTLLGVMLVCTVPKSEGIPGTPRPKPGPSDSASRRHARLRKSNQAVGLPIPVAAVQPVSCHQALVNVIVAMHQLQCPILMSLKKLMMRHYCRATLWLPVDDGQCYSRRMHIYLGILLVPVRIFYKMTKIHTYLDSH